MSINGDAIFDRLPDTSNLKKSDNPVHMILDLGLGSYMDSVEDYRGFGCWFLEYSTGAFLDILGKEYGILRKIDETDEDYRKRIILEKSGHFTAEYIMEMFNTDLFCYVEDFDPTKLDLTSDNCYLDCTFMLNVPDEIKNILNSKFVVEGLEWL